MQTNVGTVRHTAWLLALSITWPCVAVANPAPPVQKDDIRVLGRLNVNLASRDELLQIPGLDASTVDRLVQARAHGALTTLDVLALPADANSHLTVEGPSTLRRIRALPLEVYIEGSTSAHR